MSLQDLASHVWVVWISILFLFYIFGGLGKVEQHLE
jgi:hypothetical protein